MGIDLISGEADKSPEHEEVRCLLELQPWLTGGPSETQEPLKTLRATIRGAEEQGGFKRVLRVLVPHIMSTEPSAFAREPGSLRLTLCGAAAPAR